MRRRSERGTSQTSLPATWWSSSWCALHCAVAACFSSGGASPSERLAWLLADSVQRCKGGAGLGMAAALRACGLCTENPACGPAARPCLRTSGGRFQCAASSSPCAIAASARPSRCSTTSPAAGTSSAHSPCAHAMHLVRPRLNLPACQLQPNEESGRQLSTHSVPAAIAIAREVV